MTIDPIVARAKHSYKRRPSWASVLCCLALAALTIIISLRESVYEFADFRVHMMIAGEFDFSDLHSITSRLAYPLWHILVSVLYQLGIKLEWAAALVCALCKCGSYVLVYEMLLGLIGNKVKRWVVALVSLAVLIVTAIWIPSVAPFVYKGAGSPNVWHNPTQQAATFAMMLVMPWLIHCWCEFSRRKQAGEAGIHLPWWKVLVLAVLCMGSLACKPTFMQALLPAAFVLFLIELLRNKSEWRYFGQIVIAFVPSAAYFLLQYLYYTGVVVEFTSGVEIGLTAWDTWFNVRSMLMMNAFPFMALIASYRKGMFKDRQILLAILMIVFSLLEGALFRETGLREGHGNFTWAAKSAAFYMWVVAMGVFLRSFAADIRSKSISLWRGLGYAASVGLFVWHLYSGLFYIFHLLTTSNAF